MTYIGIYQLTPIVRQNVLISHQQDTKHDFKHALETTHCGSQHDGVITTPPEQWWKWNMSSTVFDWHGALCRQPLYSTQKCQKNCTLKVQSSELGKCWLLPIRTWGELQWSKFIFSLRGIVQIECGICSQKDSNPDGCQRPSHILYSVYQTWKGEAILWGQMSKGKVKAPSPSGGSQQLKFFGLVW